MNKYLPQSWLITAMTLLVVSALSTVWMSARAPAYAQTRDSRITWEHKRVQSYCEGWKQPVTSQAFGIKEYGYWWEFGPWTTWVDGKKVPPETSLMDLFDKLGKEGWELVATVPTSRFAGGDSRVGGLAGATTQVDFYFKRPRR